MTTYLIITAIGIAAVIAAEAFIKWAKANGHEDWCPPEDIED